MNLSHFLRGLVAHLEEDDAFSLYTKPFEGTKCYKMSFNSHYNSVDHEWYIVYQFQLVDHSKGEEMLEEVYQGQNLADMEQHIWQHRTLLGDGFNEM